MISGLLALSIYAMPAPTTEAIVVAAQARKGYRRRVLVPPAIPEPQVKAVKGIPVRIWQRNDQWHVIEIAPAVTNIDAFYEAVAPSFSRSPP